MNRKILLIFASLFIVSMMLTPIAVAKPGAAEKNNDKFELFQLVVSGSTSGLFDKDWMTPPTAPTAEESKTYHARGGGWITGETVELTVGSVTYTTTTDPVRVEYSTTYDVNTIRNNDGTVKHANINLHDVVTVYVNDEPIGTIELLIKAQGGPSGYAGNIVGYGTGQLENVHISAQDIVDPSIPFFGRMGTIQGFPELPALV